MSSAGTPPRGGFDRLARIYRALEFLAFGRDLERARFAFIDRLRDRRSILILGEGDGRFLARLAAVAPAARIHCIDASGAMLARAAARLAPADAGRVRFTHADFFSVELPEGGYDAAVTLFFLDCFTAARAGEAVARVRAGLGPDARWLWADFALPPAGWPRWRARLGLAGLYAFFRWQAGIAARALPPAEDLIQRAGLVREAEREFRRGFVRSAVFGQPGSRP